MAARRRNKRNVREEIRSRQAYASMELALIDHQEQHASGQGTSSNKQSAAHDETLTNSPLEAALKNMSSKVDNPENSPSKATKSPKKVSSSIAEPEAPALTEKEAASNWDGKGDSMDLTFFLMMCVVMAIFVGLIGS